MGGYRESSRARGVAGSNVNSGTGFGGISSRGVLVKCDIAIDDELVSTSIFTSS